MERKRFSKEEISMDARNTVSGLLNSQSTEPFRLFAGDQRHEFIEALKDAVEAFPGAAIYDVDTTSIVFGIKLQGKRTIQLTDKIA